MTHPFWQVRLQTMDMPLEPALEAFIKRYNLLPTVEEVRQSLGFGGMVRGCTYSHCQHSMYVFLVWTCYPQQQKIAWCICVSRV